MSLSPAAVLVLFASCRGVEEVLVSWTEACGMSRGAACVKVILAKRTEMRTKLVKEVWNIGSLGLGVCHNDMALW